MDPLEQLRETLYKSEESKRAALNLLKAHENVHLTATSRDPTAPEWIAQREQELRELIGQVERQRVELQRRTEAHVALVVPWLDDHLLKNHLQRLQRELDSVRKAWIMEYHLARGGRRPEDWQETFKDLSDRFIEKSTLEIKDWEERWRPFPWEESLLTLETQQPHYTLNDTEIEESISELTRQTHQSDAVKQGTGGTAGDPTVELSMVDATYPGDDIDLVAYFMNKIKEKRGNVLDGLDDSEPGEDEPVAQKAEPIVEILDDTPSPEAVAESQISASSQPHYEIIESEDEEDASSDVDQEGDEDEDEDEDKEDEGQYSSQESLDAPQHLDFAMQQFEDLEELDDDGIDNVDLDAADFIHDPAYSDSEPQIQPKLLSGGEYETLQEQQQELDTHPYDDTSLQMIDEPYDESYTLEDTPENQHNLQQFASAALDTSNFNYIETTNNTVMMIYPETTVDETLQSTVGNEYMEGVDQLIEAIEDEDEKNQRIETLPSEPIPVISIDSSIENSPIDTPNAPSPIVDLLDDDSQENVFAKAPSQAEEIEDEAMDPSGNSRGVSPSPGIPIAISEQKPAPSALHLKEPQQAKSSQPEDAEAGFEKHQEAGDDSTIAQTEGPVRINFGFDITADFDHDVDMQSEEEPHTVKDGILSEPGPTQLPDAQSPTQFQSPAASPSQSPVGYREISMHDMDVSFSIVPDFDQPPSPKHSITSSHTTEGGGYLDSTAMLVRSASKMFGRSPLFGGKAPERVYHSTPAPQQRLHQDPRSLSQSAQRVFSESPLFSGNAAIPKQPNFAKAGLPQFDSITKARFKMDRSDDAKFVHPVVVAGVSGTSSKNPEIEFTQPNLKKPADIVQSSDLPAKSDTSKSPKKFMASKKQKVKKAIGVDDSEPKEELIVPIVEPALPSNTPDLAPPDQETAPTQPRRSPRKLSDHIPGARSSSPTKRSRSPSRKGSSRSSSGRFTSQPKEDIPEDKAEPVGVVSSQSEPQLPSETPALEANQPTSPSGADDDNDEPLKVVRTRPKTGAKRKAENEDEVATEPSKRAKKEPKKKKEPKVRRSTRLRKK